MIQTIRRLILAFFVTIVTTSLWIPTHIVQAQGNMQVQTLCEYNRLEFPVCSDSEDKRFIVEVAHGTGQFQWPVRGIITQEYWNDHQAIDIAAPIGTVVQAADSGLVSFAGWTDVGYGYLVVIDHANGFVTYYAHLSNIYVCKGQAAKGGQIIGAVGSTGWSTGPHLHFEVRYDGVLQNPQAYLGP